MDIRKRIKNCCKVAIDNVLRESITDVDLFERPFEIDFLLNEDFRSKMILNVSNRLEEAIQTGKVEDLNIHKIGHVLVPKKSLSDFRRCAYIDVYDEIVYLTLVLLVAREIEKHRIKKAERHIFSYRLLCQDSGAIFDTKYNYTAFKNRASEKQKMLKNRVQINCDISCFYDRLNLHRLNSILLSFGTLDEKIVELLNQLLLYWANRDSYGLPVGSNASRILAEAALIEVDSTLHQHRIDFCRFVDDYRIFAPDAQTAHSYLAILNKALSEEGLFLNTGKTNIYDISRYKKNASPVSADLGESDKAFETSDDTRNNTGSLKIIRGYTGLIPIKFRELSVGQTQTFATKDLEKMLKEAEETLLLEPQQVTDLVKTIVAHKEYDAFCRMPNILLKFPQFIPYFVDAVLKRASEISEETVEAIETSFIGWFEDDDLPEYIFVYLVRLLSSEPFSRQDVVFAKFKALKRDSGDYIGRAFLESLSSTVTRKEALELRNYYYRADLWEKRAILRIVKKSIPEPELKPFLKDVRIHGSDDIFIDWIISKKN